MKNINKIMLICIFLLSVLFLLNNPGYAQSSKPCPESFKPFKMAFVPDINLSLNKTDELILYKESLVILQDVAQSLNKVKNLNFIVFGGDLIDNQDKEFTDLPVVLDVFAELKSPYFAVPGDRDMDFSSNLSQFDFTLEFNRNIISEKRKSHWAAEPVKGILLIGLDTTVKNSFSGSISDEQLKWLNKILNDNKDKFTIITMHHPAIPVMGSKDNYIWGNHLIKNSQDFLKIVNANPQIKLVLSGHRYVSYTKKFNGIVFVSSPSIAAYPNQYSLITVYPDRVKIENIPISFKQMIKKSQEYVKSSKYVKSYGLLTADQLLKIHEGNKCTEIKYNQ